MSSGTKQSYGEALAAARRFCGLFGGGCWDHWIPAGSLRRKRPECGDVEHVVVPKFGPVPSSDLFATPEVVNLLWRRMDELVSDGTLAKHVYGSTGFRYGLLYRGVELAGVLHEVFTADAENLGSVLAIRTGSADFSRRLVTGLLRGGRRNKDGRVWRCDPCACGRSDPLCAKCQGTGLVPVEVIPVPTEERFFELCGVPFLQPEDRT